MTTIFTIEKFSATFFVFKIREWFEVHVTVRGLLWTIGNERKKFRNSNRLISFLSLLDDDCLYVPVFH